MKVIESERLILRELVIEDKYHLMKVLSDQETMQYYPHSFSEKEVEQWIHWNISNYRNYKHGLWAVILKDDGCFIGDCGITMQNIDNELVPEIGFHIHRDYWNKGYATEAARACANYAFTVLNYSQIYSYTTISNVPSQRVAEKIGMKFYKYIEKNNEKQVVQILFKSKEMKQ